MPVIRQNRDKGLGLWLGLGLRLGLELGLGFGLGYTYSVFNTNEMLQSQHQFVACLIKGEVQMIFKLLLINTVKSNKKNSESLIKIGQIIRKLWYFKVSQNSIKHRYWSQIRCPNWQRFEIDLG